MAKDSNAKGLSILEEVYSDKYIAKVFGKDNNSAEKESKILLLSLDKEGTILLLEGNLIESLNLSKSELLGSNIFEESHLHHPMFKYIKDALSHHEKTFVFKVDSNYYQFYFTSTRNLRHEVSGVLGLVIDVTDQKRVENIILKKNEHIKLLYEAGKSLSGTLKVSRLYKTLFDIISQIAECDSLLVSSYCEVKHIIQSTHIQVKSVAETIDVSNTAPIPLAPEGQGIISRVIRSGKPLLINDYEKYDVATKVHFTVHEKGIDKNPNGKLTGSAMIVPIKLHGKVTGAVNIHAVKTNAYNNEIIEFIESLMHPVALAVNNALLYKAAQDEISVRKETEIKLKESLGEKESLLSEIHHRVRNNLQLILSLLNFQSKYIKDEYSSVVFKESISRIKAISLIQDTLYNDPSLSKVDFSSYLQNLVRHHRGAFETKKNHIKLNIKADDVFMNIDTAVPAGLIVNELITNSIEHAFPGGRHGEVNIEMHFENSTVNKYTLKVRDNGIGMPDCYDDLRKQSLGMSIISNLSKQLNGTLEFNTSDGTDVTFRFPPADYKQRI